MKYGKIKHHYPELIFSMGFLTYLVFFYPGFMTNDSVFQLMQAINGHFTNWHPPLMAYIWAIIDKIYPGPFGMLLLQSLLLWSGAYLTFKGYFKEGQSHWNATILVAIMFLPQLFGIAGVIWKDNLMWGSLYVVIGLSGHIEKSEKGNVLKQMMLFVLILSFLLIAMAIRINGVFAIFGLVLLIFHKAIPERIQFRPVMMAGLCMFVSFGLLALSIGINKSITRIQDNPIVSIATFDMAGIIKNSDDVDFNQKLFDRIPLSLRNGSTIARFVDAYTPEYWQKLFDTHGGPLHNENGGTFEEIRKEDIDALKAAWIYSVLGKPKAWLKHRVNVFRYVLGLTESSLWGFSVMDGIGFSGNYKAVYKSDMQTNWLQHGIGWRLQKLSELWIFRPWFYFALIFIILIFQLININKIDSPTFFVSLSGVMHESILFFIAPSPDYRYSHYMVFSCILSVLFVLRKERKQRDLIQNSHIRVRSFFNLE